MKIALIIITSILVSFIAVIIGLFIWARRHVQIEKVIKPQEKILYKNVKGGMMLSIIDDDEEDYDVLNTMFLSTHNAVIICHYVHKDEVINILKNHPLMTEYDDIDEWSNEDIMNFLPCIYADNVNIVENKIGNVVMYSLDILNNNIKVLEEGESFYDVF